MMKMNGRHNGQARNRLADSAEGPDGIPRKLKIAQPIEGANPSENYVGSSTRYANQVAYLYHGKPWFTWLDIPLMMRDSWCRFLARVWSSPFARIKFRVKATSPEVEGYVRRALGRFQQNSAPALLRSYFWWGFAPGGIEWVKKGQSKASCGRWHVDRVRRIFPQDAHPLVWTGTNKFAGFKTSSTGKVISPYAFWFAGNEEAGPLFDEPPVSGAYDDWKEYTCRGGARHNQLTYNHKCAIRPAVMKYPNGYTFIPAEEGQDPQKYNNQTLGLATLEKAETGANVAIPSETYADGKPKWELEFATPNPDAPGIREYPEWLKKNMAAGVGIPMEVIQAAETGSGYAGRMVPYLAWLSGVDEIAGGFFDCFDKQALRQGVYEAYGPKADYEIAANSLAEEAANKGDGQGGQGATPVPGAPSPTGGGGSGIPYRGPHGGQGMKDPRTGRVHYMGGLPARFDESLHPRDQAGEFSSKSGGQKKDGETAQKAQIARVPESHKEAVALASAARHELIGDAEDSCAIEGDCERASFALYKLHPEAEIWHGHFEDDQKGPVAHNIAKIGDYFIDVTGDQFDGGKPITVFTTEDMVSGKNGADRYYMGGFRRANALEDHVNDPIRPKGASAIASVVGNYAHGAKLMAPQSKAHARKMAERKRVADELDAARRENARKQKEADDLKAAEEEKAQADKAKRIAGVNPWELTGMDLTDAIVKAGGWNIPFMESLGIQKGNEDHTKKWQAWLKNKLANDPVRCQPSASVVDHQAQR